jgi:hypothetical protein
MGIVKEHPPVKYFAGITYNPGFPGLQDCLNLMEETFSMIETRSDLYDFSDFTNYYESEMGSNLKKFFLAFSQLHTPEILPQFKLKTNKIEKQFIKEKKRQINIDPGYLSEAKVVLATTKNYDHRIYLGEGIFADLHLKFSKKSFQSQPWTYSDYKQQIVIDFFLNLRLRYFQQLGEMYSN